MTLAEQYRKRHKELKVKAKQESPLPIILESLGLLLAIGIILAVCIAASPEMAVFV